jgi:hypothetical protein
MTLQNLIAYAALLPKLGVGNVLAVLQHRRRLRSGEHVKELPARQLVKVGALWTGELTHTPLSVDAVLRDNILARAEELLRGEVRLFGHLLQHEGDVPAWHKGVYAASAGQHFSKAAVNAIAGEDVKQTWDLSRLHWAPQLALAAAISEGEARTRYLARLEVWLQHWLAENGYQRGVNWACGQEVSVRGIQLMLASLIVRDVGLMPAPQLLEWLSESWRRVQATLPYAHAQQNNHSLTEHLFLILSGDFLQHHGAAVTDENTRQKLRAAWPKLVEKLILPDGGTAMYSANYHRVFCDMLAHAKLLDDAYGGGLFAAPIVQQRVANAAAFLEALIDPVSGEVPRLGLNDGSLHALSYALYWNYEPSLLLLSSAFGLVVPAGIKRSEPAVWLYGRAPTYREHAIASHDRWFDDFGLYVIERPAYRAYVKYPHNRFRPSQMDMLHLDVWAGGMNLLHDAGTFSYNPKTPQRDDGTSKPEAHNTLSLLTRPLLSKLSPFLYARWPNTKWQKTGEYITWHVPIGAGLTLQRRATFADTRIMLEDSILGTQDWALTFNGELHEIRDALMQARVGGAATMRFANVQHLSISDALYADQYLSLSATKRLTALPLVSDKPLITTISFGT